MTISVQAVKKAIAEFDLLGIMAAILTAIHMPRSSDLFGTPSGSPECDKLISASVQWARKIMEKIDRSLSERPEP